MSIIEIVFLLIALLMVVNAFFPAFWGGNFTGPQVTPRALIWLVIELVVLWIVYLIVLALFGGGPLLPHP